MHPFEVTLAFSILLFCCAITGVGTLESIKNDCDKLQSFYVGDSVYVCTLKPKTSEKTDRHL